jgi:alkylation response protein AidB-like acyl-CoA dehydrogenase
MPADPAADGRMLVQRAAGLRSRIQARAAATESDRRLPKETIADLLETGVTRALQPPRYGGLATDFGVAARICEHLARGCPSTAWVYANFILQQWHVGLFALEAQDEIWGANPDALVGAAYMPVGVARKVDGGLALSGTWRYVSGIDNADWCLLGGRVLDSGGAPAEQGFFVLPRREYRIEDDWYVVGLAGTGSKTLVAENVFVPGRRWLALEDCNTGRAPGARIHDHPIFKAPLYAIFNYFLSGVALGAAQGAIDAFVESIKSRNTIGGVTGKQTPLASFPTIQIALADAEAKVDAGRTLIQRDCDTVVATLMAGKQLTLDQRIANRRSIGFGVRLAREAVDGLFGVTGAAGLLSATAIQRYWRDVHAVAHHLSLDWNQIGSLVGGYRLGIEPVGMY